MACILVVEDEPLLRKRLVTLLTEEGHEVVEAENGREGIHCLREGKFPALILLDMVMPSVNGWGFLDFQRNNAIYANIPVVVISGFEGMALSAKPQAYLSKPIDAGDLFRTIAPFVN